MQFQGRPSSPELENSGGERGGACTVWCACVGIAEAAEQGWCSRGRRVGRRGAASRRGNRRWWQPAEAPADREVEEGGEDFVVKCEKFRGLGVKYNFPLNYGSNKKVPK